MIRFMPTSTAGMVTLLVACWLITHHTGVNFMSTSERMCSIALSALPRDTKLSFTTAMGTPNNNVGERKQLTVKANFPAGVSNNVTIEIIVSYGYIVPAFVKVVSFSVGSNLRLDMGKAGLLDNPVPRPAKEYFNLVTALDMGTITNNGYDTHLAASQMSITFEVVMANNAGLGAVVQYWTGVGMEYNNSMHLCVCQVRNTLKVSCAFLRWMNNSHPRSTAI